MMLKLNNISKTFAPGTVNEKKALDSVTLELKKGDFVTVLGSNGAGKSTLFNAIAGTFAPDCGTITLDSQDITKLPDYKRSKYIGRLFQDPLTVLIWIAKRGMPASKVGRLWKFKVSEVDAWVKSGGAAE